ncbi:C40 family peptidase [Patescibacteria group bacterium]|nr:C40 family peptidase [Patescibacteria group bacterium]
MKQSIKIIGYIVVILGLGSTYTYYHTAHAAEACRIKETPSLTSAGGTIKHGSKVILTVEAENYDNCINTEGNPDNGKFRVEIWEYDNVIIPPYIDTNDNQVEIDLLGSGIEFRLTEKLELPFITGSDECGFEPELCKYYARVIMGDQVLETNQIQYDCPSSGCTDGWNVHPEMFALISNCTVTNIELNPDGDQTDGGVNGGPFLGSSGNGEYQNVEVIVTTQGCAPYSTEKKFFDVFIEIATEFNEDNEPIEWQKISSGDSQLKGAFVDEDGKLKIVYRPGDDLCTDSDKCVYRATVDTQTTRISGFEMALITPTPGNYFAGLALIFDGLDGLTSVSLGKQSSDFYGSTIQYKCLEENSSGGYCNNVDWEIKFHNGVDSEGNPIIQDPSQFFDPNSPCYTEEDKLVAGTIQKVPAYLEDCYEFLAPIPGFSTTDDAGGSNLIVNGDRIGIRNIRELKLEDYINSIFQIALGVLMVLAVVMIIVAGVQYMTVESFYGKSDAKKRIGGALTGLILSLGIFIILNTINPRLLQINFGDNIKTVTLSIDSFHGGDGGAKPGGIIEQIPTELMSTTFIPGKIYCPGTGGQSEIPKIARSFIGVSTYRYGAKGAPLNSGEIYQDAPNKICENGQQCRTFCPENSFCIDCSGFVNHVLKCAGVIDSSLGNTRAIFDNVRPYTSYNPTTQEIDSVPLEIGDLVGEPGHVGIYIGEGNIVEATSFQNGRLTNNNTQENSFNERRVAFIKRIRKFNSF